MPRIRSAAAALLLALLAAAPVSGQGIDENLSRLAAANAELYVRPVAIGLGHALTAGFTETARTHRLLGFDLGLRVMAALPAESQKRFTALVPESVAYRGITFNDPYVARDGNTSTPTAVGTGEGVVFEPQGSYRTALLASGENPDDFNLEFPEGLDLPVVPFAVIQASVGLPYETEVTLRFIPSVTPDDDIGAIKATGYGLKHTVSSWFPVVPVDVAIFLGRQHFSVGDYLDATATTVGVIGSRSLGPLTAFGYLRYASANVSVEYTVDNPGDDPGLPVDGSRIGFDAPVSGGAHGGAGLTVRFIGLGITGEISGGPQTIASIKAGLSIR